MIRRRFQCTARELRSNPKTSCAVILSCFALHNFILQRQGPQEDAEALYAPDDGPQDRFSGECDPEGESYRQHIIHEWFSSDAPEEERSGREISSLRDILGWAVSTPTREEHGLGKLTETKNSSDMQIHACMTTYHPLSSLDHLADPAGSDHSLPWNQLVKMNPPLLLFADMLFSPSPLMACETCYGLVWDDACSGRGEGKG
ncbi:hypothetical protein E2C01_044628 [Portunus trituberculatus]|uniref:DDE Tnp4 domain-containing protein n=1 Tax=Portunus trituberculatus TaxID=210409 RepID=A0A5B7G2U6_PORTR|nr:hypothetical protein [Portunus trituberculatus]